MTRRWISSHHRGAGGSRSDPVVDLPLAETDALNMGSFSYLSDYDAYYHFHGTQRPCGTAAACLCRRAEPMVWMTRHRLPPGLRRLSVDTRCGSGESERIPYGPNAAAVVPQPDGKAPCSPPPLQPSGVKDVSPHRGKTAHRGVAPPDDRRRAGMPLTFTGAALQQSLTTKELSGYALAFISADCWQDSTGNDCTLPSRRFF